MGTHRTIIALEACQLWARPGMLTFFGQSTKPWRQSGALRQSRWVLSNRRRKCTANCVQLFCLFVDGIRHTENKRRKVVGTDHGLKSKEKWPTMPMTNDAFLVSKANKPFHVCVPVSCQCHEGSHNPTNDPSCPLLYVWQPCFPFYDGAGGRVPLTLWPLTALILWTLDCDALTMLDILRLMNVIDLLMWQLKQKRVSSENGKWTMHWSHGLLIRFVWSIDGRVLQQCTNAHRD